MTQTNLVAVQACMERADYRDEQAFRAKIESLMQMAARQADFSLPTLVAFPELIGMFLSFVPQHWDALEGEASLEAAATKLVMQNFASLAEEDRTPEQAARRLLFIETALEAERIYAGTFSAVAREFGCYVAAGSIALPPIEEEPSKGGRHIRDESTIWNTAYLFSPNGTCLQRVPKVNLVSGLESRLFDQAPVSETIPAQTAIGNLGTLICFDGFHENLVERYDSLGVEVLIKPSYNQYPWHGPSTYAPGCGEGEQWLKHGCPSIIQGRENIRYGVNAMLVGAVFEDMAAEGLSSISQNTGRPGASWQEGVLAIASDPAAEEVVAAVVEL
ncbi:MAG TPA: carbon-nitrogen hydrolase family protein [Dehalococcoidia bacterium]|nr:carbon-nitrogen hydrolase family protein [Dehalococcoidia bacterium]